MRVVYTSPSVHEFTLLLGSGEVLRKGGALRDIKTFQSPVYYQRGSGLFSILGNIARRSLPFLRRVILPAVGEIVRDVTDDYSKGSKMKDSIKKHGLKGLKNIGNRILRGGRRKRKKGKRKRTTKQNKKIKINVYNKKNKRKCLKMSDDVFTNNLDM